MALPEQGHALDLGTGSGILAVSLALARPGARITATDLSSGALALAERNAARLGAAGVAFRHGDLYDPVAPGERST